MKLFFSAVLCSVVIAIALKPYREFESLTVFGDRTLSLAPSAVEDKLFFQQNNGIRQFSKREDIQTGSRASGIQLSQNEPSALTSRVKSHPLTRTARQRFPRLSGGNSDDEAEEETDFREEEQNETDISEDEKEEEEEEEEAETETETEAETETETETETSEVEHDEKLLSPMGQAPTISEDLTYSQFYQEDLRIRNAFIISTSAFSSKLSKFVQIRDLILYEFAANKVALAQTLSDLVAELAEMTSNGNLFRDECGRHLSLVKDYYDSLSYCYGLYTRKQVMGQNQSSTDDVKDALVENLSTLRKNLTVMQVHLHYFADADGFYDTSDPGTKHQLEWDERLLNRLLKNCDLLASEGFTLAETYKEQINLLLEEVQRIRSAAGIESQTSEPEILEPEVPLTPPLAEELFNEETKSLMSEVDENIQRLGEMLDDTFKGTKMDFKNYSLARDSVEDQLDQLGGMTLSPNVETRIRDYRDYINLELKCMDTALSCARSKLCSTHSYRDGECVHTSLLVFENDVEKLYKLVQKLNSSILGKTGNFKGADKALYQDYKFHFLTLENIDTARWSDVSRLEKVLTRMTQVGEFLDSMSLVLQPKESLKEDPLVDETVICDEEFTKNINKQLQQIETALSENLDPSKSKVSTLENAHALQKLEFDKIVQRVNMAGDICVAASSSLIEKVSSQFTLIESLFSHTPSYDDNSDKVWSR